MIIKSTVAKAAALAAFGTITVGGLAVAGALPDISPASPPVSTSAPNTNAVDHPNVGAENGTTASTATTPDAGSRATGLATAAANVTNPTASAVIGQIASGTPGPGFGQSIAVVASGGAATPPASAPPASTPPVSTPGQAGNGLNRKP